MSKPVLSDWLDERDQQRLNVLNVLLAVAGIGGLFILLAALGRALLRITSFVEEIPWIVSCLVIIGLAVVRRIGYRIRLTALTGIIYFVAIITLVGNGVASQGVWYLFFAPTLLFPMAGWRVGLFASFLSILVFAFFAAGHYMHWLDLPRLPDPRSGSDLTFLSSAYLLILLLMSVFQAFFTRRRDQAMHEAYTHATELVQARETLQQHTAEVLHTNEQLRTQSWLLNVSAYLVSEIAGLNTMEALFDHVVEILRQRFQRFGIECVGIFMQDPEMLRGGEGETVPLTLQALRGKDVMPPGFLNTSDVVSRAAHSGEVVFGPCVANVEGSATPAYELAVPLHPHLHIGRTELTPQGALYFCSTTQALFEDLDEAVWLTLASQLAVAMQNVSLLQQALGEVQELRLSQQEYTERSWRDLFEDTAAFSYRAGERETATLSLSAADVAEALRGGRVVARDGTADTCAAMALPIKVRDAVLGVVEIQSPQPGATWSREQLELVDTVVDQLGVALDSARLYQESQRRATREQLTREITDEMRRSITMETILQTAVESLGQAIGVPRAYVRLRLGQEPAVASSMAGTPQEGDKSDGEE